MNQPKNQLQLLINETLSVNTDISHIIINYACKYTPFPIYSKALINNPKRIY